VTIISSNCQYIFLQINLNCFLSWLLLWSNSHTMWFTSFQWISKIIKIQIGFESCFLSNKVFASRGFLIRRRENSFWARINNKQSNFYFLVCMFVCVCVCVCVCLCVCTLRTSKHTKTICVSQIYLSYNSYLLRIMLFRSILPLKKTLPKIVTNSLDPKYHNFIMAST
jgi:hypothetical protein